MKTLLTLFVLLFSSMAIAEDISDFEIEGMSIGDSLLDYFSEEEIKNNVNNEQKSKYEKFSIMDASLLKMFDALLIVFESPNVINKKPNKNLYLIKSFRGAIRFPDQIDLCKKEKIRVIDQLSELFIDPELDNHIYDHQQDSTGRSKVYSTDFYIDNMSYYPDVRVECYDWDTDMGFTDHLSITIYSQDYAKWFFKDD